MRRCAKSGCRSTVVPDDQSLCGFVEPLIRGGALKLAILLTLPLFAGVPAQADDDPPKATEAKPAEEKSAEADRDEYFEMMRTFIETFEQIDRNYVKDVDRKALMEAAVRGMLSKLDPYSDYISPEDRARFARR